MLYQIAAELHQFFMGISGEPWLLCLFDRCNHSQLLKLDVLSPLTLHALCYTDTAFYAVRRDTLSCGKSQWRVQYFRLQNSTLGNHKSF